MKNLAITTILAIIICFGTQNAQAESNQFQYIRSDITTDVLDGCRREVFTLFSMSMQREISIFVLLPPEYEANPDKKYPILYTLHGMGAPYASFSEMSPLRKKLADQPMIVAGMDAGYGSFYLDAVNGGQVPRSAIFRKPAKNKNNTQEEVDKALAEWEKLPEQITSLYTTFFFNEFVPALDNYYRVDTAKRSITGFSMGGFGAMHYMLQKPDFFVSVSGLSSAFYSQSSTDRFVRNGSNYVEPILGPYPQNAEQYKILLFQIDLVKQHAADGIKFPPIYQHCGTEDHLLEANRQMHQALKDAGYSIEYKESPGAHNWSFWRDASAAVADFHWQQFATAADTAANLSDASLKEKQRIEEAIAKANATGKKVLVNWNASWCPNCRNLNKFYKTDKQVRGLLAREFIVVTIDHDKHRDLEEYYGAITGRVPTLTIFDGEGNKLANTSGKDLRNGSENVPEKHIKFLNLEDKRTLTDTQE